MVSSFWIGSSLIYSNKYVMLILACCHCVLIFPQIQLQFDFDKKWSLQQLLLQSNQLIKIYLIFTIYIISYQNLMSKFNEIQLSTSKETKKTPLMDELEDFSSPQKKRKSPKKQSPLKKKYIVLDQTQESQQKPKESLKQKKKDKQKKFSWPLWKRLFKYTKNRKWLALSGLLSNVIFAVVISLLPLKIGETLDYITKTNTDDDPKSVDALEHSIQLLGLLVLAVVVTVTLRLLSLQFLQEYLSMDIKNDIFGKFIRNDMCFFEKYKIGQLNSRLSSDINQAKSAVSNQVTFFIRSVLTVFGNIVILFVINWKLAFFVISMIPFYSFFTRQYTRKSRVLIKQNQDVQAQISSNIVQKFSGIQLVKAFNNEERQIKNHEDLTMKCFKVNKLRIYYLSAYMAMSEFLPYLGVLITLFVGGKMVINGDQELTAGQLTSFILYCTVMTNATKNISDSYTSIINGTFAVVKVFEMTDYESSLNEQDGRQVQLKGTIQFQDVEFKYPGTKSVVLKKMSFKIERGEYVAFVGESGSGKSTIIKLIEKYYPITGGQIYFNSQDNLQQIKAYSIRRQIGIVSQQATMFSGTIEQNIIYGLDDYTYEDLVDAAEKAGCLEFLENQEMFPDGFKSKVGQKGGNLSGGQKQRVAIARALIRKPKIIIFDEATSALDANSQKMVQQSIQSLAHNDSLDNPTIIVIAHRLSTIINTTKIFVMKEGQIIESGSHEELRNKKGYYFELIEKQLAQAEAHICNC